MKYGKLLPTALALSLALTACSVTPAEESSDPSAENTPVAKVEGAKVITLSSTENADGTWSHSAMVDGETVTEYDYTWNVDVTVEHDEVKNAPAEYYTGTAPDGEKGVYIAHDIFYYPELPQEDFVLVQDGMDSEWAYYYQLAGYEEYIFGTLPAANNGKSFPTEMMHSAEDAYQNAVLHITEAGVYQLEGTWHGQIWIDLGDTDDTFADPDAKVTIYLGGTDVTCTVAPALVFYSVYECDNTWEDRESYSAIVDTAEAGANVVIMDGTVNNFEGTNVYRMYKTTYKKDGVTQKKLRKVDAAFYSYVSMNIDGGDKGDGVLNITSGFEGLDTELHLTVNGGNVNIYSQDDGINVNEDGVSVVTFNGGSTHILAGLGSEGDGVDSNGFLTINGGTVISMASPISDAGLDSDCGSFINGGTVVALGSTMDWAEADEESDSAQAVMNLQFSGYQSSDEAIIVTDTEGNVVFAFDPDKDEVAGNQARQYQGAIVSSPDLKRGETYLLYVGGDVDGTEAAGVYDIATVTGFSEEARQQCYNGTFTAGRPNGMGGGFGGAPSGDFDGEPSGNFDPTANGGERPDDRGERRGPSEDFEPGEDGEMPELPDDFDPTANGGERPDDKGERREPPEGFEPSEDGEMPELPDDFDPSQMGGGFGGGKGGFGGGATSGDGETDFVLTEQVNNFSNVMDYAPAEESDLTA